MQKALLTGFLAVGLMAPAVGYAQPAPAPAPRTEQVFTLDAPQWLMIGAVVVVGAVVLDALPGEVGYLVVGAIGGYLATIWYNGGYVEVRAGASKT